MKLSIEAYNNGQKLSNYTSTQAQTKRPQINIPEILSIIDNAIERNNYIAQNNSSNYNNKTTETKALF